MVICTQAVLASSQMLELSKAQELVGDFEANIIMIRKLNLMTLIFGACASLQAFGQADTASRTDLPDQEAPRDKTGPDRVQQQEPAALEQVVVTGSKEEAPTHFTSPSVQVSEEQIKRYNVPTVEDVVKYEPSLIVRRRFIGDPNGTLGIRGANMFQTTRSMVFADGLPLHYLLQTQFNGAPRWSLVAPDEAESIEVVYGPFSAEYSGNAMGGVVNIKTRLPQKQEAHAETAYFWQPFDLHGTDETFAGHREFASYGNRFGDLSVYLSYNHLNNEGHPQSFHQDNSGSFGAPSELPGVTGAFRGLDARGNPTIIYGDLGPEDVDTDLVKLKLGYNVTPNLLARFTFAYEDRDRSGDAPKNYLRDAFGNPLWGDNNNRTRDAVFNGEAFRVVNADFGISEDTRETFLFGAQLEGELFRNWWLDTTVSYFDILKDERIQSNFNPADPRNNSTGRVTEFEDTGWVTYDLKFNNPAFLGRDDLGLVAGYHYDHYRLTIRQFNSNNFTAGTQDMPRNASGGDIETHALFAQLSWRFLPPWDVTVGARQEWWQSEDGFFDDFVSNRLQDHPDRDESEISPKFSLGFEPGAWKFRYSLAKAFRFPIVEELFQNAFNTTGTALADASLQPEDGLHHNFSLEYGFARGYARVNVFREDIEDTIFNQTQIVNGRTISTFLPIDEVGTTGVEFLFDQQRVFNWPLDFRFNVTWLDAEIEEHKANPALEGNKFPRLPDWQVSFFTTYPITDAWEASLGGRYQSDAFIDLDNRDTVDEVFGAVDSFFFLDFKTTYHLKALNSSLSFGIDNLTDETAFVFHPWPQRTYFVEASLRF